MIEITILQILEKEDLITENEFINALKKLKEQATK